MNSLHLFYKEKISNLLQSNKKTIKSEEDDEESNCPICEEKKVTLMINCLVSFFLNLKFFLFKIKHFFCNDCIDTWLMKKKNNCPICRYEIDLKDYEKRNKKNGEWTIVDFDNNDYKRETEKIMNDAIKDIMKS